MPKFLAFTDPRVAEIYPGAVRTFRRLALQNGLVIKVGRRRFLDTEATVDWLAKQPRTGSKDVTTQEINPAR